MDALRKALGVLSLVYALIFFGAALLHAGTPAGPLTQPAIVPAVIVETLCAVGLLAGGYGALTRRPWAWDGLIRAHAGALGGVLIGILALALRPSAATALTTWFHDTMAILLAGGLAAAFYASRSRR
ncbi:hypothetical protein ACFFV7_04965 [Nonomuraea spiralis]|uniref:Uncharacterized protein n=1 Tax=Nonomuraea spiralis TaxID=46182 RepID=A0ABV5I9T7_9ACTN|nr:hypothetical protein [Nonomuraea spiralis]